MRTKNVVLNYLTDAIPQIIILLLGVIKSKVLLQNLGESTLGLYQLYGQILSYLILVEGGVGSALLFRLYKPIHDHDQEKINSVIAASKIIFSIISLIILVLGIIISFNMGFFIKDNSFSDSFIIITFILYLLSSIMNYINVPYRSLFDAYQNRKIPNLIFQLSLIVKSIVEMVIVILGHGLIEILISLLIISLLSNIILLVFYKKYFPNVKNTNKKDFSMLTDVKHLFVNTIANLVSNNIDIILISKFIGLKYVVIYNAYNYFVEGIKQFVDKIVGATMSSVGDVLLEDKTNLKKLFYEYNCVIFFIASVLCVPFFLIINSFINIFYEGEILVSQNLAIIFTTLLFLSIIKIPIKVFSFSSGNFKIIKKYVIVEIVINLSLSLLLINKMGISGVLIATIISIIIADFILKAPIIIKKLIHENCYKYYKSLILNTLFTVTITYLLSIIFPQNINNILFCLLYGVIFCIINIIVSLIYYYFTKQLYFMERIKQLFKRR